MRQGTFTFKYLIINLLDVKREYFKRDVSKELSTNLKKLLNIFFTIVKIRSQNELPEFFT